jgi:glycosyltransferase involved in cell wall biosynthesis
MSSLARIVHVYKDIYPPVQGGIERIISALAGFTADEYEILILVASRSRMGGRRFLEPGSAAGGPANIQVIEVPSWGRWMSTPLAPGFITALKQCKADLIHFHAPHPTGELAYLLSGLKTPAVVTYHSDVVRQRLAMMAWNPVYQRFLGRMQTIMPTSRRYMETSEQLNSHRSRCRVVPLGYPLDHYSLTTDVRTRRDELLGEYGEFILFLGCLRQYKGLPYLLEALTRLSRVRAVIAGDGAMASRLKNQAAELGLGDRAVFTGHVSDPEAVALLHAASILVLPAHQRSEAFGLCQVEAMACGLPVISTNLPTAVPEVNLHGTTGLVVPPAEPDALAAAIRELLASPDRRKAMGAAGKKRALEKYSIEHMAIEVKSVYADVLNR